MSSKNMHSFEESYRRLPIPYQNNLVYITSVRKSSQSTQGNTFDQRANAIRSAFSQKNSMLANPKYEAQSKFQIMKEIGSYQRISKGNIDNSYH
mmetsp:Transcript_25593/g.24885  ORF Transcript_25593/g.24885 Transcript_25593/m.24885 type:complete len:94 (-) Transcript_25593:405-686(-)